ncbi:MAG: eukaryotic-like serine/threonine-protein kinase, partial [Gaiellaceae bacterium]|nr:eukaryotic-like serine/threonine-protein kinase [Gaiellaceae bacterium]
MGQVWLARDVRSGLDVALKIVPREGKTGQRAEREARAAASLRHDRCQRILALARDPSHVYIAYEYIPGRTLREALRGGEIDDRAALEVAAQISDALAHAHGRGIVHRDVKPSNVLLAQHLDPPSGRIDVRLLDFGLAQMAEFDTLTGLGDIPGTLAYISPERLQGLTATAAADVWGVGVLLWEALAGEHPFWGGDMVETSRRIQQGAPGLETLRPDLQPQIVQAVASALLLNPQRRPSAERLARDLRDLPRRGRKKSGSRTGSPKLPKPSLPPRPGSAVLGERLVPGALAGLASGW